MAAKEYNLAVYFDSDGNIVGVASGAGKDPVEETVPTDNVQRGGLSGGKRADILDIRAFELLRKRSGGPGNQWCVHNPGTCDLYCL